jgi:hypothetical protein
MHVLDELGVFYDRTTVERMDRVNDTQTGKAPIRWVDGLRREVERLEYSAMTRYGYLGTDPTGMAEHRGVGTA